MNEMFLVVLVSLLGTASNFSPKFVPFERIPKECASSYRDYAHELFSAPPEKGTLMAKIDFDNDGCSELLIFNGEHGSGGEGWSVFCCKKGKWYKIGEVFGTLSVVEFKTHSGLLVCRPAGWEHATWEYFEFSHGQFIKRLEFTVTYAEPDKYLRDRPRQMDIKM